MSAEESAEPFLHAAEDVPRTKDEKIAEMKMPEELLHRQIVIRVDHRLIG